MTTASDDAVTAGALLRRLRAMAVDRLRSAGLSTDLRVVAMTGSGTVSTANVAGTNFSWWKKTSSTGPFALCYAVAAHANGKPISKYQADGCRWGWENSYARGAKDVALKATTLSNGPSILRDGSVFLSPAYVVLPAEQKAVTKLLEIAYAGWLKGADPWVPPGLVKSLSISSWPDPSVTLPEMQSPESPKGGDATPSQVLDAAPPESPSGVSSEVPRGESPEIADALAAIGDIGNPRRGSGRRLSSAENKAIEERAVEVVCAALQKLDYVTEDVGATRSYDVHATKDGKIIKVEVKGTTTDGSRIYLTANEVDLHVADYPNNALAIVRRITLDKSDDNPVATGGELELTIGWELDRERLKPLAYTYSTGL